MKQVKLDGLDLVKTNDYINFYSQNSEDKIFVAYKRIYGTYDAIASYVKKEKGSTMKIQLELLEQRLTRQLDVYTERVSRGADGDFKEFNIMLHFNNILCNALKISKTPWIDDMEFIADSGKTILDRLEIEYQCREIVKLLGKKGYERLLEYYKTEETKTQADRKFASSTIKSLQTII